MASIFAECIVLQLHFLLNLWFYNMHGFSLFQLHFIQLNV